MLPIPDKAQVPGKGKNLGTQLRNLQVRLPHHQKPKGKASQASNGQVNPPLNKLALPFIRYSSLVEDITGDLQNTTSAATSNTDKVVGNDTSLIIISDMGLGPNSDTVLEPDLPCPVCTQGVTEEQALVCERCH